MNYHQKEEFQSMLNHCVLSIHNIHNVWAVAKKMNSCFDITATATEWINGIQKIMLEFIIAQITKA